MGVEVEDERRWEVGEERERTVRIGKKMGIIRGGGLKVHKHEFFFTFFAETETIWSQGPVTRDF